MNRSMWFHVAWVIIFLACHTLGSVSPVQACCITTYSSSDSTEEFITTTSPWLDDEDDRPAFRHQQKIKAFARANFERLKEDMAVGQGDYLAAFATLMQVPQARQGDFFELTKINFHQLYPSEDTTPTEMLTVLSEMLTASSSTLSAVRFPAEGVILIKG